MKHYRLITLIFILSIFANTAFAQSSYIFKVLASSGKIKPKANGKVLFVGNKLNKSSKITLPSNSYLSLVHNTGGTVQIAKAGTYSISALEAKLKASRKSVSQKYASYVIGEMTSKDDNIAKSRYKYQNVTGSVERATFDSELIAMLPDNSTIFAKNYTINWHHLRDTKTYIVKIINQFDEDLLNVEVEDTTYTLDLSREKFAEADLLKVFVLSKDRPDVTPQNDHFAHGISFIDEENREAFDTAYKAFKKENISEEPNAADKLSEAFFFEDNGYLLDALQAYEEVIRLAPEVGAYQVAYRQFLVRKGIGKHKEIQNTEMAKDQ